MPIGTAAKRSLTLTSRAAANPNEKPGRFSHRPGSHESNSNMTTNDLYLAEGEEPFDGPIAIMRTFVLRCKTKVLTALAELSYVAGREGDDEWAWAAEAEGALIDAFFAKPGKISPTGPRGRRYESAYATLSSAFHGGRAQREIDLALTGRARAILQEPCDGRQFREGVRVPEQALAVARARAVIYLSEIEFADERHPHAIESAIHRVAVKVARRHAVTEAEAAYCALKAFEELGLVADWSTAAEALAGAASGHAERQAEEEDARERAVEITNATAGLFGVQE